MSDAVSLKDWSAGTNPDKNDLLSWSNLIYERSLQVKDVESDSVSEYFFSHWLSSEKDPKVLIDTFERTFSVYGGDFQVRLMKTLKESGTLQPIALLDKVKPNGFLQRYLLTDPDVWKGMAPEQLRDKLHTGFDAIIRFGQTNPQAEHAAWSALKMFKTPKERSYIFNAVLASTIRSEFGLFHHHQGQFDITTFHAVVHKMSDCWNIEPAQVMYGLLFIGFNAPVREYDRYKDFIEPYANDIRELIQFSTNPRDENIRQHLPDSVRSATMDMLFSFAFALDSTNLFMDRHHLPSAEHDPEAAHALGAAF